MFSIPDMGILAVLALLVFGPEKLPGIMRKVGRVTREVQSTSQTFIREMERAGDMGYEPSYEPPAATPAEPEVATPFDDLPKPEIPMPFGDARESNFEDYIPTQHLPVVDPEPAPKERQN
jgi:Sec-independent protein translocase protein TatA